MTTLKKISGDFFECQSLPKFSGCKDTSEALAEKGIHISAEKLSEMATQGIIPHFRSDIDKTQPLFLVKDLFLWLRDETMFYCGGGKPTISVLNICDSASVSKAPLRGAEKLLPTTTLFMFPTVGCPVVYFLIRNGTVVYVGQSTCLGARIGSHIKEGEKVFDSVYYSPVSYDEICEVEERLIRELKPEYNVVFNNK